MKTKPPPLMPGVYSCRVVAPSLVAAVEQAQRIAAERGMQRLHPSSALRLGVPDGAQTHWLVAIEGWW